MNSHIKLDIRYHNMVTIGLLLNAFFPEKMLLSAKLYSECVLNLSVNYSIYNYRNCRVHFNWSVILISHSSTIFCVEGVSV